MDLKTYSSQQFIVDLNNLKRKCERPNATIIEFHPEFSNYYFWGGPKWQNFQSDTVDIKDENKIYFIVCLYTMTLADQSVHTYFQDFKKQWDSLAQYPKFGWVGFGMHFEKPKYIIETAIEHGFDFNLISDNDLDLFVKDQFNRFPVDTKIDICSFFNAMLNDIDFTVSERDENSIIFRLKMTIVKNLSFRC